MGLDSYVRTGPRQVWGTDSTDEDGDDIWYGRKIYAIHVWMQQHSALDSSSFNCERLDLTTELLDLLHKDWFEGALLRVGVFGDEREYVKEEVGKLVTAARQALAAGDKPYYYSSW